MKSLVLFALLLFCSFFFSFPTLRAQELFIACDSLATAGRHLMQTPDGGFLVETYSTAGHSYPEFGFALVKLDASGRPEWGRLYPATMGDERATFHPHAYAADNGGNIVAAGSAATSPFHHVPAIARFTPHGVPIESSTVLNREGRFTDLEQLSNGGTVLCGTLDNPEMPDRVGTRTFAGGIIAAVIPGEENVRIYGIKGENEESISSLRLFRHGSSVRAIGTINAEGCCVDNPILLLELENDGSVRSSEFLTIGQRENEETRVVITPGTCITTDSATFVAGILWERTPKPRDNPRSMPGDYSYRKSPFVLKLDRENNIVWGRRIRFDTELNGPFAAAVTTGGEIVLTSTDENDPAILVRLSAAGELVSAHRLAEGIDKRFDYPDIPHAPLAFLTMTALAPTSDGGIAGLCRIDVPAEGTQEMEEQGFFPHYGGGFFRLSSSPVPQCGKTERETALVEPVEFVRRPFAVRTTPITPGVVQGSAADPLRLAMKPVSYLPETRELCEENHREGGKHVEEETGINLAIYPNSLFAGKDVEIEYNATESEAATAVISLLNASSGRVYATVSGKEGSCNGDSGRCAQLLGTTDLPPGIYLVRVKIGEREETAKLHVK